MTPKEQLHELAKQQGIKLRETRSARAPIVDSELLCAVDDSYYRNCIVSLPFSRDFQLKLSWAADVWDLTESILPDKSRMFSGNLRGKRWAIILE